MCENDSPVLEDLEIHCWIPCIFWGTN